MKAAWLIIFCLAGILLSRASAAPQAFALEGGESADAVLRRLDRLAARAEALAAQQELERSAVAALRDACAPSGVETLYIGAGHVAGRCARPAGLGVYRITSSKALRGARLETAPAPSTSNRVERPGAAGEDLAVARPSP